MTDHPPTPMIPVSTHDLERWRVQATMMLSREFAETADVSLIGDHIVDKLALQVRQTIWGLKVGDRVAEWPADWWQAFKARWFPRWALRRGPVVLTRARVEARDLFPDFAAPPGARRAVIASVARVSVDDFE